MNLSYCGIDFGTSNSALAWMAENEPKLARLEGDNTTLPSAIFFHTEQTGSSFGRAAISDYLDGYEGRLMKSLKSILGTSLMESSTELSGSALSFKDILTQYITEVKHRAEASSHKEFKNAVFGRPVYFVDGDEAADKKAANVLNMVAQAAGFDNIEFQYEPLAAAFELETRIDAESLVLVADIGAGTSDFSLIRLGPDNIQKDDRKDDILANAGVHIGGTDYDKGLSMNKVMPELGHGSMMVGQKTIPSTQFINLSTWHRIPLAYSRKSMAHLEQVYSGSLDKNKIGNLLTLVKKREGHLVALRVETAKINLTEDHHVMVPLADTAVGLDIPISRSDFEAATQELNQKLSQTITSLLSSAGISSDRVDAVLFTGGTSSVPSVKRCISALLPSSRIYEGDLFGAVALGLALDGKRKFK